MKVFNKLMAGVLVVSFIFSSVALSLPSPQEGYWAQFTSLRYWTQENYKNTKWWATCGAITGVVTGTLWYFSIDRRTPEQVYQDACKQYDEVVKAHNKHISMVEAAYHITDATECVSLQMVHEELLEAFAIANLSSWSWYDNTVNSAMNQLQKQINGMQDRMEQLQETTEEIAVYRNMNIFIQQAKKLHIRLSYLRDWYKQNRPYFTLHSITNRLVGRYSDSERSAQYSVQQLQTHIEQLRNMYDYPYTRYLENVTSDIIQLKQNLDATQYASSTGLVRKARLLYKDLTTIKYTLIGSSAFNRIVEQERERKNLQAEREHLESKRRRVEQERKRLEQERLRQERKRQELEKRKLEQAQQDLEQERQRMAQQQQVHMQTNEFTPSAPPMSQEEYEHYYQSQHYPEPSAPPMEDDEFMNNQKE